MMEGTLTALSPGFNIVAEARRFAAAQFNPDVLRKTAAVLVLVFRPDTR